MRVRAGGGVLFLRPSDNPRLSEGGAHPSTGINASRKGVVLVLARDKSVSIY